MISTVLVSLLTSVTVSLMTFILGLRAGKNQSERLGLKEHYRKLVIHFEAFASGMDRGRPKSWDDFYNSRSGHYEPLVDLMKKDGSMLDLPKRLASRMEAIEKECLNYGYEHGKVCEKLWPAAVTFSKEHAENEAKGGTSEFTSGIRYFEQPGAISRWTPWCN